MTGRQKMKRNSGETTRRRLQRAKRWCLTGAITGVLAGAGALGAAALEPAGTPGSRPLAQGPFQPSWESLRQYRCPEWFRDAKFGISARWDAQSVPEQGDGYANLIYDDDEADHKYHVKQYGHPSQVGFKEIIRAWRAERWEPEKLTQLYQRAGAHYFVALANDYDNFDCFDSKYQPWNSVHIGPRKDVVGTWARAARQAGLRFGVTVAAARAWSWFSAAQTADDEGPLKGVPYDGRLTKADGQGRWWEGYDPQDLYAQSHKRGAKPDEAYVEKFFQRTRDLIDQYHPDLLAFDDTGMPLQNVSDVGLRLAAHYYNANMPRHGGRLEAVLSTQGLSDEQRRCLVGDIERGIPYRIEPYPWQTETSLGHWAYWRSLFERHAYKTPATVIQMLADIVSKNGNLLLNLPLRGDGTLDADEAAFLRAMARWMQVNQEAIFGTRPWRRYGEGPAAEAPALPFISFNERIMRPFTAQDIRFAVKGNSLYAIACGWPESGTLTLKSLARLSAAASGKVTDVHLLGHSGSLEWTQSANGLTIRLPSQKPGDYAYAFKIRQS
jgi:alpha-L-fucosidase